MVNPKQIVGRILGDKHSRNDRVYKHNKNDRDYIKWKNIRKVVKPYDFSNDEEDE